MSLIVVAILTLSCKPKASKSQLNANLQKSGLVTGYLSIAPKQCQNGLGGTLEIRDKNDASGTLRRQHSLCLSQNQLENAKSNKSFDDKIEIESENNAGKKLIHACDITFEGKMNNVRVGEEESELINVCKLKGIADLSDLNKYKTLILEPEGGAYRESSAHRSIPLSVISYFKELEILNLQGFVLNANNLEFLAQNTKIKKLILMGKLSESATVDTAALSELTELEYFETNLPLTTYEHIKNLKKLTTMVQFNYLPQKSEDLNFYINRQPPIMYFFRKGPGFGNRLSGFSL